MREEGFFLLPVFLYFGGGTGLTVAIPLLLKLLTVYVILYISWFSFAGISNFE